MARTSRNPVAASSMDALDNIDLDDMFADEGDALFDGLDIDLNMDDITGATSVNDDSNVNVTTSPLHEQQTPTEDNSARARRPNKRKIRSPVFFDDDDDDYTDVHKKKPTKKRPAKPTGPTKKVAKTKTTPTSTSLPPVAPPITTIPAPTPIKGKKNKSTSSNVPPSNHRGAVAAAGQFGGRNKRGGSFTYTLPKAAPPGSLKAKPLSPPPAIRAASMEVSVPVQQEQPAPAPAAALAQIQATHPGLQQGAFCGLLPSNTLFYPFMPALPNEPSLKHRKLFPIIDRIHTTFMTTVINAADKTLTATSTTIGDADPIVALMQECYKEVKPSADDNEPLQEHQNVERTRAIALAAGESRRAVALFEKHKLAGDLFAICSLLKRQHDFLKQNKSNMEQWCKSHFTEQDFAAVFLPPKQKLKRKIGDISSTPGNVLASLNKNLIKVKVVCFGFKEASSTPLYATLRVVPMTKEKEAAAAAAAIVVVAPRAKKSKLGGASTSGAAAAKITSAASSKTMSKTPSYVDMKPLRRRRSIIDLISRSARDLETRYIQRCGDQNQIVGRQRTELQKVVDDDKMEMIHTGGMWRWLEKSGHFAKLNDAECRWRLEGLVAPSARNKGNEAANLILPLQPTRGADVGARTGSYWNRLQSLLVCEESDDGESSDDETLYDLKDNTPMTTAAMDVSKLSSEERSFLSLRSFGLLNDSAGLSQVSATSQACNSGQVVSNGAHPDVLHGSHATGKSGALPEREKADELSFVIAAMVGDLKIVEELNSKRARFLESMSRGQRSSDGDAKIKNSENNLISKCHQLMKKHKEKGKGDGKPRSVKNNDYALPW